MTGLPVEEAITRVHHEEWARVLAGLARRFGDLDVAEEAAAEAFVAAVERWPRDGIPPNPGGCLATTATRKRIPRGTSDSRRCSTESSPVSVSSIGRVLAGAIKPATPRGSRWAAKCRPLCSRKASTPEWSAS